MIIVKPDNGRCANWLLFGGDFAQHLAPALCEEGVLSCPILTCTSTNESDVVFELERAHSPGAGADADTAEIAAAMVSAHGSIHWRGKTVVHSAEVIKADVDAMNKTL